jgi:hypothetical protein
MQITINVPDSLPQERLKQRIKELEQSLINEAKFFAVFSKQQADIDDPWTNPDISLPTVDTGLEDFSINQDHLNVGLSNVLNRVPFVRSRAR